MKTTSKKNHALGPQYSARMVTIKADLLTKRSLTGLLCLALAFIMIIYLISLYLRKFDQFLRFSSANRQ